MTIRLTEHGDLADSELRKGRFYRKNPRYRRKSRTIIDIPPEKRIILMPNDVPHFRRTEGGSIRQRPTGTGKMAMLLYKKRLKLKIKQEHGAKLMGVAKDTFRRIEAGEDVSGRTKVKLLQFVRKKYLRKVYRDGRILIEEVE